GKRDGELVIEHFGRRCQGLVDDPDKPERPGNGPCGAVSGASKKQCDFRFRFKTCEECGAENDIAARRCNGCDKLLVDADDKLKDALKLKDAKVLRVSGMQLEATTNGRGLPRLKVTYHDEDGSHLSEWFALETPAQRRAFYAAFLRYHLRAPGGKWQPLSTDEVVAVQHLLRYPDFVVGRKVGRHFQIRDKLFDYTGRYRKAVEAG
ncbi:MAG: ATP-dependent helicase, partial [Halomonadaceae bacterium]